MAGILLIETPTGAWDALRPMLAESGHVLATAPDLYAALAVVETAKADIALLDVSPPKLDGPEGVRHLLDLAPDLQLIVAVAPGAWSAGYRCLAAGASDFVPIPLTEEALHVALSRAESRLRARRQLRRAVDEIHRRHEFERRLIMTSMDGIIANDPEGRIIVFNEGAARIYGYSPAEAMSGLHVTQLYPEGEARRVKKALYGPDFGGPGRLINYTTLARTKSNQLVPIVLSVTLIREAGAEVATVGYFKDLGEIMRQLRPDRFPLGPGLAALLHELLASVQALQQAAKEFDRQRRAAAGRPFDDHCKAVRGRLEQLIGLLESALQAQREPTPKGPNPDPLG